MKPLRQMQNTVFISFLVFFLLACNAAFSVVLPTPTLPAPTGTATETAASLISQQVTLVSIPFDETTRDPISLRIRFRHKHLS